jgi:hypothetical protein
MNGLAQIWKTQSMREGPSAQEQLRELYSKTESAAATVSERLVQGDSFGELLAKLTENTMALTRLGFDAMDLVVRNLRLAGRNDVARLARQLARTEDKLEMVLQEVEALHAELAAAAPSRRSGDGTRGQSSANGRGSGRSSARGGGRRSGSAGGQARGS